MPAQIGLNSKQKRFVEEYLVDCNATQAATRAGYSAHTAAVRGCELLKNPLIVVALDEATKTRSERTEITQDWVLQQLKTNVERAFASKQYAAANKSLELIGTHLRMFDQPKIVYIQDIRDMRAGQLKSLTDDINREIATLESGGGGDGAFAGAPGTRH